MTWSKYGIYLTATKFYYFIIELTEYHFIILIDDLATKVTTVNCCLLCLNRAAALVHTRAKRCFM